MRNASSAPIVINFPLDPVPASRPRVTRFGTFYAARYKRWMAEAKLCVPVAKGPLDGPLQVTVVAVCRRPKRPVHGYPHGDADNFVKGPLDVLTRLGWWHDDAQVCRLQVEKRYARGGEQPGTVVTIQRMG